MRIINQIPYPQRTSEFEVQAEVYRTLKCRGFDVRGSVCALCDDDRPTPKRVFFDIVVFKDKQPIAVIECKNHTKVRKRVLGNRQSRRYSKFGVPILCCFNMSDVEQIATAVSDLLKH